MKKIHEVIDNALSWADVGQKEVTIKRNTYNPDSKITVYCYCYSAMHGAYLPEDFTGDITKYLCDEKKINLQEAIDYNTEQLKQLEEKGCQTQEM